MNNTPNSKKKSKTKTSTPKTSRSMGQYSHLMRSLSKSPMKKDKNTAKATPKREKSNGEPRANNEGLRTPPSPGVWLGAAQTTAIVEGSPESRNEISTPRRLDTEGNSQQADGQSTSTLAAGDLQVITQRLDDLERDNIALKHDNVALKEEVKKIGTLEKRIAVLDDRISGQFKNTADLKTSVSTLEKDMNGLKRAIMGDGVLDETFQDNLANSKAAIMQSLSAHVPSEWDPDEKQRFLGLTQQSLDTIVLPLARAPEK